MDQPGDDHLGTALAQTLPPAPPPLPLSLQQQHLSLTTTLSPLDIPEVMANIFGWLDDETINRAVVLVCRQWFVWTRHRLFRDLYWNSERPWEELEKDVLSRLVPSEDGGSGDGLKRLFCYSRHDFRDSHVDKWARLGAALLAQEQRQESRDGCAAGEGERMSRRCRTEDRNQGVRYLTIRGTFQFNNHMWSILSGLSKLTSLTVKVDSCGWISMPLIFRSCPQLESLHIETLLWVGISGSSWVEEEEEDEQGFRGMDPQLQTQSSPGTGQGLKTPHQQQHLSRPLAIRSLVFRNLHCDQHALEDFLSSAPLLHRLQVANWLPYLSRPKRSDFARLLQLVQTRCLHLQIFHFSYQGQHTIHNIPEDMNAVLMFWPRMPELMISTPHFTPEFVQSLSVRNDDVLTTLEIVGEDCSALHEYLCTGARHLRHLRAGWTRFPFENMDVHLRLTNGFPQTEVIVGALLDQQPHQGGGPEQGAGSGSGQGQIHGQSRRKQARRGGIWACRGLLTLHLALSHMDDNPQASRIVFGYISRVCPRLRELEICGSEGVRLDRKIRPKVMCLTLEGGFCLLTRLKDLERLVFGIVRLDLKLRRRDVEWMVGKKEESGTGRGEAAGGGKKTVGSKVQLPKNATESIVAKKGWSALLRREMELELARRHNYRQWTSMIDEGERQTTLSTTTVTVNESKAQDAELEQSLQDLGLLKDVVQCLQELESSPASGERCWPYMRRMSIYSGNRQGETFEKEYERLLEGETEAEKAKAMKEESGLFARIRNFVGSLAGR